TGPSLADALLQQEIGPLVRGAGHSGQIDAWFFVRYADPEWHLRLRLHGPSETLHAEVLPALQSVAKRLLAQGRLRRLQFDTYVPEYERYGGEEGLRLAERIFHIDSESVLDLLALLPPGDAGLDARWRLALVSTDRLLDDLGLDLAAKR